MDEVGVNRVFHDHECHYYDERFAIVHDERSARRALREVETLLGRPLCGGEVVLDVGCGTGWLAAGLRRSAPHVRVVGLDLAAGMLERARQAGAWPLVQGLAGGGDGGLPIRSGSVDLIVGRGVLHHLPDPLGALAEWRRALRPGGVVVLSSEPTPVVERHGDLLVRAMLAVLRTPLTPEDDFWELAAMAANLHVFTLAEMRALATGAGFASTDLRSESVAATLVLTASYVLHGRRPALARRLPWRDAESAARAIDAHLLDHVVPERWRHGVVGRLTA